MPRPLLAILIVIACLALPADSVVELALAQAPTTRLRTRPRGRFTAPPPKWDASVRDIFFLDARQELGPGEPPSAPLAGTPSPPMPVPAASAPVAEAPATGSTTGAEQWSKLISPATIEDEVKSISQSLSDLTQTAGKFKSGGYQDARVQLSVLAALFGIIADYDADVRWKDEAGGMWESIARAGKNAKAGSDTTYQEARARATELIDLVRGGAVGAGEAKPRDDWSVVADRRPLMTRLEIGQRDRLNPWTSSAQEFERNSPELLHEAELLTALSRIIQAQGYEYGDDDTYQEYARQLEAALTRLTDATRASDHAGAQEAAAAANKSCEQCHADFRS